VTVAYDRPFVQLALGYGFSCGLDDLGQAVCWGSNSDAQLGKSGPSGPIPTAVSTVLRFVRLSAGASDVCGLTPDHSLYCWGANADGEITPGGVPGPFSTPTLVPVP